MTEANGTVFVVLDDSRKQGWDICQKLTQIFDGQESSDQKFLFREVDADGTLIVPVEGNQRVFFTNSEFFGKLFEQIKEKERVFLFIDLALTEDETRRSTLEGNYNGQFVPRVAIDVIQSLADAVGGKRGENMPQISVFVYSMIPQLIQRPDLVKERLEYWVTPGGDGAQKSVPVNWFPWESVRKDVLKGDKARQYLTEKPYSLFLAGKR